jgi:hypothetical protein
VIDLTSFFNVLASSIRRKVKTREEYETIIAAWALQGWLTEQEVTDLLILLDEIFPVEE